MEDLLKAVGQAWDQNSDYSIYKMWKLTRTYGGMNGVTYHAENPDAVHGSLAVKIRKRDDRNRAQREFFALQAFHQFSEPLAPEPLSLYTHVGHLPGDIVICSWVEGEVLGNLNDASLSTWNSILTTLSRVHSLHPNDAPHLVDAVLPIRCSGDVIAEIEKRLARLPDGKLGEITKAEIKNLFENFKLKDVSYIQETQQPGLILCDITPSNMIQNNESIFIVDWENSGWGDPAFDMADLLVRPECGGLTLDTRQWILSRYAELTGSWQMVDRILRYERLMLIFWLILTTNGFTSNQVPRFPGARMFTLEETRNQQVFYLQRIEQARSSFL